MASARANIGSWAASLLHRPGVALLGFSIPQAWMYAANQQLIELSPAAVAAFYAAFAIALGMSAIVFGRSKHARTPCWILPLALVFMGGLSAIRLVPELTAAPMMIICVLGGIGAALCFQEWFYQLGRICLRDGVGYVLVSFALAGILNLALSIVEAGSPFVAGVLLVIVPFCCLSPFFHARKHIGEELAEPAIPQGAPRSALSTRQLVFVIFELVIFSFLLGLLRGEGAEAQGNPIVVWVGLSLRIVAPLLLLAWVGARLAARSFVGISQVVLIVTAIVFVALAVSGDAGAPVAAALTSLARNVVLVLLTVILLYITRVSGQHPWVIYGIGRGIHALGTQAGIFINLQMGTASVPLSVSANVATLIVATTFLLLAVNSAKAVELLEDPGDDSLNDETNRTLLTKTQSAIDERCAELVREHDLTQREGEVLQLICRGRSRGYIAEALGISENTVRFHARNVYAKLSVHSKQELLTLIGLS